MTNINIAVQGCNKKYRNENHTNKNGNSMTKDWLVYLLEKKSYSLIKSYAKAALYNADLQAYTLENGEQVEGLNFFGSSWKESLRWLLKNG